MCFKLKLKLFGILFLLILTSGCATYYYRTIRFQELFESGNVKAANKQLDQLEKKVKNKDRLLFYFEKGVVLHMLGDYQQSNDFFEKAYLYVEDYRTDAATEFASLLTNPGIKPYKAEDHEAVLIHYYKALNYIMMVQYEEALVECRRINNKLNTQNDKYQYKNFTYKVDAFALNLMGVVYEANGQINDAFIAYRNAYNAYNDVYKTNFNISAPKQLKRDLLRTAYLNGFTDELKRFEKEFDTTYVHQSEKGFNDLIFFWHNGLGPVKDEWSINFAIQKGEGGAVMFVNEEMGLAFPFFLSGDDKNSDISDLKFVRVAFPKYVERSPVYNVAYLSADSVKYALEPYENINAIAFKTLEDRMIREVGTSLLRLALKQLSEEQLRKENENMGMVLSIANALTEKADTRNWQTLPHTIFYSRIKLAEGQHEISLNTVENGQTNKAGQFQVDIHKGRPTFLMYHSLESNIPEGLK
jgi:hypothetical protein